MEAAWRAGRDFWMPMGHAHDSVDTADLVQASLESAIPASNRGYALLQRLGWKEGKGLGRNEDGARACVSADNFLSTRSSSHTPALPCTGVAMLIVLRCVTELLCAAPQHCIGQRWNVC